MSVCLYVIVVCYVYYDISYDQNRIYKHTRVMAFRGACACACACACAHACGGGKREKPYFVSGLVLFWVFK